MLLDLRGGFGKFHNYELFKFPDGSTKFKLLTSATITKVVYTLRSNEDIIALLLVSDVLSRKGFTPELYITYMMYQQDDRNFSEDESFGLKVISNLLNTTCFKKIRIFHPHSDKVEFIDNVEIISNLTFIEQVLHSVNGQNKPFVTWVIPDAGAFKTQFKFVEKLNYPSFITCMKSRDFTTGDIQSEISVPREDVQGRDFVIFDDICLGGATFINIAKVLKDKGCGKLYLAVSHGIFNKGVEPLLEYFEGIYTTDSICTLSPTEKLKIIKL
jgi:ribose-phosphate pyrophosphokinase